MPGTINGAFRIKSLLGIRRALGEDAKGLTDKQAFELFCRQHVIQAYNIQDAVVDGAAESAADRAAIDTARASITTREANIVALRGARRAKSDIDWA